MGIQMSGAVCLIYMSFLLLLLFLPLGLFIQIFINVCDTGRESVRATGSMYRKLGRHKRTIGANATRCSSTSLLEALLAYHNR